jgi:chaperonin cofactor prefoldin
MSTNINALKKYIKELIKQELEEASTTGAIDGGEGPPKTPYAFSGGRKKDKEKEDKIAKAGGYMRVKEDITVSGYSQLRKPIQGIAMSVKDLLKGLQSQNDDMVLPEIEYIYEKATEMMKMMKNKRYNESVNEGKYHDYRNDESMTPKQKIGQSMREVRNALSELSKLIDMNIKLKNELNVNSQSYWKNTHKALHKISERLVKLANKVGQLQ